MALSDSNAAARRRVAPPRLLEMLGLALFAVLLTGRSAAAVPTTVDLLVLYTPGVTLRYADPDSRISQVVNVANQIYADSGVEMELQVVHSEEVDYSDEADSRTALSDLTYPARSWLGRLAAELREEHGADLVVLMRPYARDRFCGLAWIGGDGSNGRFSSRDRTYAFSHVSINCSDYVLAHELGHNMGLQHSRRQNSRGGTFDYSLGHGVERGFVTVMAYRSAYGGRKIYRFSNPDLLCDGRPCGFEPDGKRAQRSSDAARSLQLTRKQFAGYSDNAYLPPPPTLRLISPAKKAKLRRGEVSQILWEAGDAVQSVDLQYRCYWREGAQRLQDAEWTVIASGLSGVSYDWTVPADLPASSRIKLRVVGENGEGEPVVWTATRLFKVRKARTGAN